MNPTNPTRRPGTGGAPGIRWPGQVPLRPLSIGEIFAGAWRVVRQYAGWLIPLAVFASLVSAAARLGVLALDGGLAQAAKGTIPSLPANPNSDQLSRATAEVGRELLGTLGSLLVSSMGAGVLAGVAAPAAASIAVSKTVDRAAIRARLAGKVGVLIAAAVAAGVAATFGLVLLVFPGIYLWVCFYVVGPVVAMEFKPAFKPAVKPAFKPAGRPANTPAGRPASGPVGRTAGSTARSTVGSVLRRSAQLTVGLRGRVFGIAVLSFLVSAAVALLISLVLSSIVNLGSGTSGFVALSAITAVVGGLAAAWTAAVGAMVYMDLRMRKEGLGPALWAAAHSR